jgi:hypothetical protein
LKRAKSVSIVLEERLDRLYPRSSKLVNPPISRALKKRGAILLGFLGIMALPLDELIAQQPAKPPALPPPQPPARSATPNPATASETWETRHAGDLTMEAPFPIEDGPDLLPRTPEKVRSTLVSIKTFKAGSPKQGFQISVTTILYKPGVPVQIDEAIKRVTAKLTELIGDTEHKFIIAPTKVSGLDARYSEFHGTAHNGRPFYAAFAVAQEGQKIWEVEALSANEAMAPDLARIMASITIDPAP